MERQGLDRVPVAFEVTVLGETAQISERGRCRWLLDADLVQARQYPAHMADLAKLFQPDEMGL